jgi:hypothetical protein
MREVANNRDHLLLGRAGTVQRAVATCQCLEGHQGYGRSLPLAVPYPRLVL